MRVTLRPVLLDVLLAAVLTGLTVVTIVERSGGRVDWLACALGVLTAAPVALRQRAPVVTALVAVGAIAAYGLVGYGYDEIPNGGIGMLIGVFTVATLRSRRVAAAVVAVAVVVVTGYLTVAVAVVWSQVAQAVLVLLGAWVLGEGTRRWAERTERLAAQAATAVAAERGRIARELHDVVAHHMAVVALQAGLARYVIDTDVPTARGAITAAGDAGREALGEMRRLLDVLRIDDPAGDDPGTEGVGIDAGLRPQPGLGMLDELVARTRGAGLPVEVVVGGRVRDLPPGADLCAYRVVQESLTNVLKHAGPATARLTLDYGEQTITVGVTDDGSAARVSPDTPDIRHGIRGMRERAELYGGTLTAGPSVGGGFAVVARLPIEMPALSGSPRGVPLGDIPSGGGR